MAHTYEELKGMNVGQLRELAEGMGGDAPDGFTQLNKEHLLPALCQALGIEMHEHHEVVGINKKAIKAKIRTLKAERDAALEARDKKQAKAFMHRIHRLKHEIRKATV